MEEKTIFKLIEQFNASSITSLDFDDGTMHLQLKRKASCAPPMPAQNIAKPLSLSMPAAAASPAPSGTVIISSPIVAAFYACGAPDTPPFVKVGDRVKTGDTLCILEAMKMMNKLLAEFDCEIVAVKAVSGDLVEYGAPLFEVKKV